MARRKVGDEHLKNAPSLTWLAPRANDNSIINFTKKLTGEGGGEISKNSKGTLHFPHYEAGTGQTGPPIPPTKTTSLHEGKYMGQWEHSWTHPYG